MSKITSVFNKKIITNFLFFTAILVLLFVPSAKAFLIKGLMKIGLFKPAATEKQMDKSINLSSVKFRNSKGVVVDLGSLKGKVVFINFWATWCPPCLAEMPSVNKLYEQFKNNPNVLFLLVDADSDFEKSQKYMDKKKYELPVYAVASAIPDVLFKGSLPTTAVLDTAGDMVYHGEGAANYADKKFIEFIEKLITLKK
ncbi:TlpA family protein disulfide reductase [Pedobacter sp.]|uniref:TlpA family protein disulfide reductase n=1 Tax=Pedobacter sp. TaxID=1411316 RepID=UPI003D7F401A